MDSPNYSALRNKNLQEQNVKLKELGVVRAEKSLPGSRKRGQQDSCFDDNDDDSAPVNKRGAHTEKRRGRKPTYYESDPDDPDFDADDPALKETPEEECKNAPPVRRGRPPGRPIVRRNESQFVDVDKNLYCEDCKKYYEGDCTVHGPLNIVTDIPVPVNPEDINRARKTAPPQVRVADTGRGVYANEEIPPRTRFGPYQGKIIPGAEASAFCWEIKKNGKVVHCVDAKNPGISNWIRYVNRTRNDGDQNLNAFQYQGELFYRSTRTIKAGEELLVWGGHAHGRQPANDSNKLTAGISKTSFKCPGCTIAYISQDYVDRHIKVCRKLRSAECTDEIFKCPGCACAYSSKDYLDRHKKVCRKIEAAKVSDEMFKCPGCKCAYATNDYLERHKKLCRELESKKTPHEVFPCPGCKCAYSSADYLIRHKKICRQLDSKKVPDMMYKCNGCQTAYSEQVYLDRHKKSCRQIDAIKNSEPATKYECPECHSAYIDLIFFERHKKVCEGGSRKSVNGSEEQAFECVGCHSTYGNLEFLDRHKLTCVKLNPPKRGDLKCPTCSRSFADQTLLNRHRKGCEKLSPPFSNASKEEEGESHIFEDYAHYSSVPKKKTGSVSGVKKEPPFVLLKRVPFFDGRCWSDSDAISASKPLKCPDCNDGFTYPARLNIHRLSHLSQTVYVCSQCSKTFVSRSSLVEHVMSHNRGDFLGSSTSSG